MNYIKTIIFLVIAILYNYIIGGACAKALKKEHSCFNHKVVFGALSLFFLGFVVGLPAHWLAISWKLYFIIFSIVLLAVLIFSIYFTRDDLKSTFQSFKKHPGKALWLHLKKHWFIYLLVLVFTILSVTNTQPYLWCNYHDDYYIAKVVNLQGAPHLLDEQYILGLKLNSNSLFGYAKQQGYRAFNTYELTYAYLGSLFTIDLTFFCRFSMAIYMYLMCFYIYRLFTGIFIKNENLTQYAVALFTLLMIPAGYAASLKFPIRMFENWRIQTAIYYGGSFVRVMGLPLIILSCKSLLKNINKISLIEFIGVIIVLFSFQITALTYLLFILPILLFVKIIWAVDDRKIGRKKWVTMIILISIFIIILLLSDKIIGLFSINSGMYQNLYNSYMPYYNDIFIVDIFALTGFIPIVLMLYIDRHNENRAFIHLIILFMYLVFRINKSTTYLAIITNYQFYGILRIITSVLIFVVFYWGLFICSILIYVKFNKVIIPILSGALVVCTFTDIYLNQDKISKYTKDAESATPLGYSLKTLTANDKMLPDMIANVGNYFNKKPYGNYRLLSEGKIPYKNTYIDNESFLLASNRIELWFASTDGQTNIDYTNILKYLEGKETYKQVENIFKYAKFKYVFTTRSKCKDDLLKHNFKVVLIDRKNHSWLLELQN